MGKSKSQTIGYHYLFDIIFGLGRGPVNGIKAIRVGDKAAWTGDITENTTTAINKPELFGGEKKEGGIQGPLAVYMGAADQVLPGDQVVGTTIGGGTPIKGLFLLAILGTLGPYAGARTLRGIKSLVGDLCSDFRGVVTVHFSGLVSSMNPYPKEWKFRQWRTTAGWMDDDCWYPDKATIRLADGAIDAMNPAHIIYECLTNKSWGRGLPVALIDGADGGSFAAAANQLCSEAFGLCFQWQRSDDIEKFIGIVLEHINGVCYLDRVTGKMALRLIRDDYDPETVPVFTPSSGLLEITEDDSSSQDAAFNEVIGTGHDPITDLDIQVRVHNLAARQSQGAANADDKAYPGIPTKDLLTRVCQRDLRTHASGLKKFTVVLDRRGYAISPGMPFRIQDPRRGIADIVLRAGDITDGELRNGKVTVKAMQDVFGMPDTSFVTPSEGTWTAPPSDAEPAPESIMLEAGWRDVLAQIGAANAATLSDTDAYIGVMGLAPNTVATDFELLTRVSGESYYTPYGSKPFTGTATLAADIGALDTEFEVLGDSSFGILNVDQAIWIGNEIDGELMELVDFDPDTSIATVTRGNADTVPRAFPLGARLWTLDDDFASDGREYAEGETVEAKLLTRTSSDLLAESEATTETITVVARQARPYPPGNFKIEGVSIYLIDSYAPIAEPVLTWAHRDRLTQEDQLVAHGEPDIGPEAGVTYTVRIIDEDGITELRETTGIAATTWTYDSTMQGVDGAPNKVYIELESDRAGIASWQKYRVLVTLNGGYGLAYGYNYGGA